jgi:ABC-type branched-subunit amino acid transport system ATPase component/branched-subunit amino acid ABC-type transport system permease component
VLSDYVPFLVIGLAAGSVYGLAGTGLVLTYKTSGIFNFAHGAVATVAAYVFFILHVKHGVPWPVSFVLSVLVLGPLMGLLLELMARRLADVATVWKVAGTVGLVLGVKGFFTAIYGQQVEIFPPYLPTKRAFTIADVIVGWDQVIVTALPLIVTAALFAFFRYSRLGLCMRAVVDNNELLDISGTSPAAVRRWSWVFGATFAALAGVLLAPSLNLDALLLTLIVVQAFGAAAVGYFSNLPLTYVGGVVIGIAASVATKEVAAHPSLTALNGLPQSIPFIILFIVLIVTPRRRLVERRFFRPPASETYRAPRRVQFAGAGVVLVLLLLVPVLVSNAKLGIYTDGLTKTILFLSLGLLVRLSGQVSLCHAAFAAVGAVAFSHFTTGMHIPWLLALTLAGLVAVPVGAFVAIPAIRLSGVFLALATFGFGITIEQMGYPLDIMFGSNSLGSPIPRPGVGGLDSDRGFYYVVLVFVVISAVAVVAITHSRLGRLLRGMADSPLALRTHGANVNTTRVLVFCISAFLAAIAGGLYGASVHTVISTQFSSFSSLTLLTLLVIVLFGEPWYALLAGASLTVIPSYISGAHVTDWMQVLFGLSAVSVALQNGLHTPAWFKRTADRLGGRRVAPAGAPVPSAGSTSPRPNQRVDRPVTPTGKVSGLAVEKLTVRFGGNTAVDRVTMTAPRGRITGLIGPNGAGKTTTFDACSGLLRPSEGMVRLDGRDVTRLSPARRAQRGLGRTFQRMELFDSLTVRENVVLGGEAALAGSLPWRHLVGRPGAQRELAQAVDAAIELCGIGGLAGLQAGQLSTGQRRLVELARCLAGPFDLLLLDEPSSGLDGSETTRFGEVLREVVAERGIGILLVEHDMALVMKVCEYIYVLDFGKQIFEGTPADVATSAVVRAAYLGSEDVSVGLENDLTADDTREPAAEPA